MSTLLNDNDKGLIPITNAAHLTSLYASLEQLVYIQIAALYYQDNSFLSLFLRWIATTNFVPPAALALHRVPVVLLLNVVCVLTHLFGASPAPVSDGSRGYMDGSVLIDFVGEFAHTSRFKLIAQDFLLLGLHILMMVVGNLNQKATEEPKEPTQDIDAEEQGVRRGDEEVTIHENGDIEMQALLPEDSQADTLPPLIELNVMREIKDVIKNNAALYNRARAGNEETIRAVLQAVQSGRTQPQTGTTTTDTVTTTAV